MHINGKNILELIQRMLGYLGWAAHDPVLTKCGLERKDIKELSNNLAKNYAKSNFIFKKKRKDVLEKTIIYFQKEENRNPGNLHTLTGFNPEVLSALVSLIGAEVSHSLKTQ